MEEDSSMDQGVLELITAALEAEHYWCYSMQLRRLGDAESDVFYSLATSADCLGWWGLHAEFMRMEIELLGVVRLGTVRDLAVSLGIKTRGDR